MKISWHTTTVFALATATTVAVGWCALDAPYQQDWRHVLMLMAVWLLVPYVNLLLGLLRSNRVSYDTFAEVPLEVGITWANGYVYYGAMSW